MLRTTRSAAPARRGFPRNSGMSYPSCGTDSMQATYRHVQALLTEGRALVDAMVAAAQRNGGLNEAMADRLISAARVPPGAPGDAAALAELLVFSQIPLVEVQKAQGSVPEVPVKLTSLIVQSGLAEQQNFDHSLREGAEFCPAKLEATLDDWIYRGSHRQGAEDSPLSKIARFLDKNGLSDSPEKMCEYRFRLAAPCTANLRIWRIIAGKRPVEGL